MARTRTQSHTPSRRDTWLRNTFAALGNPTFRVLWTGTLLSYLGFMMSGTAQSLVAFDLTGNNRAVGAVMFGQGVAMLLLAPVGGAMADRVSKRALMLTCQSVIGLTMLATAVLITADMINVWHLAAGSFVLGMMFSFLGPVRQAYIGVLVAPSLRGNAVALAQVAMNLTRVAGPFLAGSLLAWRHTGAAGTYFFMALLFVFVVGTMAQLPPSQGATAGRRGVLAEIRSGLAHIAANPRLLQLVVGFVLVTMTGLPYGTVLPGLAQHELHIGTGAYGLLLGVSALGGLAASLAVASMADSPRAPRILVLSSAAISLGLVLTGLAPTFAVALVTMFLLGAASSAFQTLNSAVSMRETDPAFYGRVLSVTMLAYSGNGLVALPIGALGDAIGERATLMAMGVAVLAVAGLLRLWALRLARP